MDWDWAFTLEIIPQLLQGLVVTVEITVLASALAMVVGLVLAVGARSGVKLISYPVTGFVEFIRRTPLLVQLYCLFYVLPDFGIILPGFVVGVIGLGLHNSCYIAEVYRAGIEGVPRGQWDAATAINLPRRYVWTRVVLPQAIPPMIPALGNYILFMFKESALLAAITVVELMNTARIIANENYQYIEPITLVGLFYLAVSVPSAFALRRLEDRLARRAA